MVHDRAPVTFFIECQKTKLGESVYVVGSDDALGGWSCKHAAPLSTNAATFPIWQSERISLPAGRVIEFKFVILEQGCAASMVTWESFHGNRKLEIAPGMVLTVNCTWDDMRTASTATQCPPESHRVEPQSLVKESGKLSRTSSGAAIFNEQMEVLCNTIAEREPMRRNFSQTLLRVQDGGAPELSPLAPDPDGLHVTQTPLVDALFADEDADLLGLGGLPAAMGSSAEPCGFMPASPLGNGSTEIRGVSLQHVSSFSALTEMAPAEVKAEARKRRRGAQYTPFNTDVPVVIVSSEIAPWSKSGGLGLVAASYSYEFARNGHRTMAISPKYQHYDGIAYVGESRLRVAGGEHHVRYWHLYKDFGDGTGCDYVFVDHPCIERGGGLYNGADGREYGDNLLRFTILSAAAMEAPLVLSIGGFPYGDKVVFLANDWQSGLVPLYLCYKYRRHNCYMQARCMYVIHNLGYQGQYPHVNATEFFCVDAQAAHDLKLGQCVNLCKGALICADRVLTVSPNYAYEVQTPEGGFGLDNFVRGKAHGLRLSGILNGIDDCWDPETDAKIHRKFSIEDFEQGKRANKAELQRMLGLHQDEHVVLIGFVGRLTWQKGVDVIADLIDWLMKDTGNGVNGKVQLIMMGNGEDKYAQALRWAEGAFRGRVCGYVGFDPKVEHQMMAGCDLFLMPSRYEPCGLPQMYSQAYGSIPVVHATGGLKDSVKDISLGLDSATGFLIPYMAIDKIKGVLYAAMEMPLKRPGDFRRLQRNAMSADFYWPQAMDQYEQNIDYTLYDPPLQR